ncbi:MAG: tRNA (adenosine(37)-N6)-dimethylallyltransferase MiaA [Rhodospirillales bacterium]|nr:tRNA (adenosine(37)-N6)-dimethylallyltransferase MiaA [Rhodospirillales bacterium]
MSDLNPVLLIAGPTASGKSALAMDLAETFDGVVINADSMQVYQDLRLLTARPSADDEPRVPHRLFGVMAAAELCSVGHWLNMATTEIESAWGGGRLPLVTGGTGMYVRALTQGLAHIPEIPDDINAEVRARYDEIGGEAFREELASVDPDAARRLPAGDSQRLTRAMAVVRATGQTLDTWQAEQDKGPALPARYFSITVLPERESLYAACEARFDAMLEDGALAEVEAFLALGLDPALPAMKAVGVPELARYLAGEISLEEATEAAKQATRNFAKRQLTWLRNQVEADYVVEGFYGPDQQGGVTAAVKSFIG